MTKTARQLVHELATCVTCGKEHEPRSAAGVTSYKAPGDGHPYRTKLFELTGSSSTGFLELLREMAG